MTIFTITSTIDNQKVKMLSQISLSTWNINGIHNKVLGNETKNRGFVDAISNIDFMFLTETWNDHNLDISGFETINSIIVQPNQKLLAGNRVVSALYSKANLKIMLPLLKCHCNKKFFDPILNTTEQHFHTSLNGVFSFSISCFVLEILRSFETCK